MRDSNSETEEFLLTDKKKKTLSELVFGHYILEEREVQSFAEMADVYVRSDYRGMFALAELERQIDAARTMYDLPSDAVAKIRGSIHIASAAGLYGVEWRPRIRETLWMLDAFERHCRYGVPPEVETRRAVYVGIVDLDSACQLELDVAGKSLDEIRQGFSHDIADLKKEREETEGGQGRECW